MHKFNIVRASFTEIMNFGVSIDTVLCSIIDPQGIPDELFYATFRYCSDILCLPSVVIMKSGWSSSFICSLEFSYTPFLLSIGDRFPHEMIKSFENCCSRFCPEIVFSRPLRVRLPALTACGAVVPGVASTASALFLTVSASTRMTAAAVAACVWFVTPTSVG